MVYILEGYENYREDHLFAVFNHSLIGDRVRHIHLGALRVPVARGVKNADDMISVFNRDRLAVASDRWDGPIAHNFFKERNDLNILRVCLNVAILHNHFSPTQ